MNRTILNNNLDGQFFLASAGHYLETDLVQNSEHHDWNGSVDYIVHCNVSGIVQCLQIQIQ